MGNLLGFHNISEQLCESCYDDYQTSLSFGSEPLDEVAARGHVYCLRALIEAGPRVRKEERHDVLTSALTSAPHNGHLDCMQILFEAGADVNQNDYLFHSPLSLAAERDRKEAIEFLIEKGADVNVVNDMYTGLARAAMYGQYDCVDVLLKAGADVNMFVNMGYTALMYAAQSGSHSCVELLIQAGADVNIRNTKVNTALTSAATGTRTSVTLPDGPDILFNLLISAGADANTVDKVETQNEQNAVNRIECIRLLLQSDAKVNVLNKLNLNALCSHVSKSKDLNKPPDRTMVLLLYAAGETLDGISIDEDDENISFVLDYLQKREISLKHICREVIRKHLLKLDPFTHLFSRATKLGLPRSLSDYLLYEQSLRSDSSSALRKL